MKRRICVYDDPSVTDRIADRTGKILLVVRHEHVAFLAAVLQELSIVGSLTKHPVCTRPRTHSIEVR